VRESITPTFLETETRTSCCFPEPDIILHMAIESEIQNVTCAIEYCICALQLEENDPKLVQTNRAKVDPVEGLLKPTPLLMYAEAFK